MNRRHDADDWTDVRREDIVIAMSHAMWGRDDTPEFFVGVVQYEDPVDGDCMVAKINDQNGVFAKAGTAIGVGGYALMSAFNGYTSPADILDLFNLCKDLETEWSARFRKMQREFELTGPVMVAELMIDR